jgi:TonB family protein
MKKKDNITSLLNRSGYLTAGAMERYLKGNLSNIEMDAVKKHLEASPFDREALEGFKKHGLKEITGEVSVLNKKILNSVKKPGSAEKFKISAKTYWYAAAGIILLAGISLILILNINQQSLKNQLAVNKPSTVMEEATGGVQPVPGQPVNQFDTLPKTMQNIKIIEPVPAPPETKVVTIINDNLVVDEDLLIEADLQVEVPEDQEILAMEVIEETESEEIQIFMVVEQMPEFPGGEEKLYKFLAENIHYPQMAKESGIQGRVFVTFVVERDGSVVDIRVLRGIGGGCDEEAIRVVKAMPKWIPGKQRGKPVRVQYNLPVKFTLE